MHRAQRIDRTKPKTEPQIIDNRQPKAIPQLPLQDPAIANIPLRTVIMLEVGDMEHAKVQLLVQEVNKMYDGARGGVHYIIPVRHGRISTNIFFEHEWEAIVRDTCEIRDGEIKLKDGATECQIVRQQL